MPSDVQTGGATFTPRLDPRPTRLNDLDVLYSTVLNYVRSTVLCVIFLRHGVWPIYIAVVTQWLKQGWSERSFLVVSTTVVHAVIYWGVNGMMLLWGKFNILQVRLLSLL